MQFDISTERVEYYVFIFFSILFSCLSSLCFPQIQSLLDQHIIIIIHSFEKQKKTKEHLASNEISHEMRKIKSMIEKKQHLGTFWLKFHRVEKNCSGQ